MLPEEALVSAIAAAVGEPSGDVVLGIGDDAAVLDDGTVVSTDILVEGVHFDLARTTPREVGHRAATANLSDLAAMGARPVALLAAFGLPDGLRRRGRDRRRDARARRARRRRRPLARAGPDRVGHGARAAASGRCGGRAAARATCSS